VRGWLSAAACYSDASYQVLVSWESGLPAIIISQPPACRPAGAAVNEVVMTDDGRRVVTVSKDCTARIWDAESGECLHVLSGRSMH
jgi:WD40 repeat protein